MQSTLERYKGKFGRIYMMAYTLAVLKEIAKYEQLQEVEQAKISSKNNTIFDLCHVMILFLAANLLFK